MNNLPITDYSAAWLDYLLHENNLSKNTIEAYQRDLTAFFAFITQFYGQEITLELLAKLALSDFRSWLSSRYQADFNSNSTKRALSAVKNFFHFLEQQHNIINSAIGQVKSPKTKQNLPKVISGEQVKDLVDNIRNNSKAAWLAERDLAIILLLFGAGLRISEALSIAYQQFSEASNFLTIRGKGSKERVIPLLPIIKEQINQYVTLCPYHFTTDSALFFGAQGSPLNRRSFNENLSKLQLSLGWLESFSPHSLRHGFATALLNSSNNIRYIQELLGHASLASTQVYTKTSIAQLSNIYQRFHPLGDTKEDKEK